MNATTVAGDLAKQRFELAVADEQWRILERRRVTRAVFGRWFVNRPACCIVMEACGSSHHWARTLAAQGHEVVLLPAQYVRACVRRNKTDAADASALIEAARSSDIRPVPVKSIEHQAIQQLHRLRSQWIGTRTARINLLRSILREFGSAIPVGARRAISAVHAAVALADDSLPPALRALIAETLHEIAELERRARDAERQLRALTGEDPIVEQLLKIPGIGLLTATALRAAIVDIQRFPSGRHLASWLGLTAREYSSGERRRLGRISKRGDAYLRTLLIHGARALLNASLTAARCGRRLDQLRSWAIATERRCGYNKATVALANKLARIVWTSRKYERPFDGNWASRTHFRSTTQAAVNDRTHDKRIGRWRGKVVNYAGPRGPSNDWLRARDSHHVQRSHTRRPATGRIHGCSRFSLAPQRCRFTLLAGGVHTRVVRRQLPRSRLDWRPRGSAHHLPVIPPGGIR